LRHLLGVQVVAHCEVGGGADGIEDGEDLVLLDEAPGELDGLGGVVGVVVIAVLDLAAVYAPSGVHVVEVRLRAGANGSERSCLSRERDRASEQDRRLCHARIGRRSRACGGYESERGEGRDGGARDHFVTGVRNPGSFSVAVPTRARAVAGIGRSR
jgi:hypothetical protein